MVGIGKTIGNEQRNDVDRIECNGIHFYSSPVVAAPKKKQLERINCSNYKEESKVKYILNKIYKEPDVQLLVSCAVAGWDKQGFISHCIMEC